MNHEENPSGPKHFTLPEALHGGAFACVLLNVVLSPWCFGSWEMWWFWPMTTLLFAGCFFSGAASLFGSTLSSSSDGEPQTLHFKLDGKLFALFLVAAPFLLYAFIRSRFPSAPGLPLVAMEAERSLLLFFTPAAIALIMFLSFTRRRLRILAWALFANALIIALYAIIGKLIHKEDYILWVLSPWTYGGRAKAPFFCPNHLSAYLNLGLCLCLALVFTPKTSLRLKAAAAIAFPVMASANFLTLSRGGILSILVGLLIALPSVAMRGHRLVARLLAPVVVIACIAVAALAIRYTANPLMERISSHNLYKTVVTHWGTDAWKTRVHDAFWYGFDRGMYIQSALRAWKSNPVWGIGPGQHSNRWAEFNPTDDAVQPINGDPATMKRPRYVNNDQHLYEVHSDWTQLLEEYGVVGMALFLIPTCVLLVFTFLSQSAMNDDARDDDNITQIERALPLASILACVVMSLHSFGDFSFQMPSIVWTFAFITASGVLVSAKTARLRG